MAKCNQLTPLPFKGLINSILIPAVNNERSRMRLIIQAHFTTKRYNWSGVVWDAVIRPSCVVEMFHLSAVITASNLECPNYEVGGLFSVSQSDIDVTILFLFSVLLRPVQLTLRLNTL